MQTILIAHHDVAYAEHLAETLRAAGYRVITCPGPWPPVERCIRCDKGYCPLTEGADLMIYDACMTAVDTQGRRYNLAVDSALAHQDVPMVLAWSTNVVPDAGTLRAIRTQAPHVHVGHAQPERLLEQIHDLLAAVPAAPR